VHRAQPLQQPVGLARRIKPIDPSPDEIDFIRRLAARQGETDFYGRIERFKIERIFGGPCELHHTGGVGSLPRYTMKQPFQPLIQLKRPIEGLCLTGVGEHEGESQ
jgi:hypothetical protein